MHQYEKICLSPRTTSCNLEILVWLDRTPASSRVSSTVFVLNKSLEMNDILKIALCIRKYYTNIQHLSPQDVKTIVPSISCGYQFSPRNSLDVDFKFFIISKSFRHTGGTFDRTSFREAWFPPLSCIFMNYPWRCWRSMENSNHYMYH